MTDLEIISSALRRIAASPSGRPMLAGLLSDFRTALQMSLDFNQPREDREGWERMRDVLRKKLTERNSYVKTTILHPTALN